MSELKPSSLSLYLTYKCKCGASHMVRDKEVEFPGGVLCHCGERLTFKKFSRWKIKFLWEEQEIGVAENLDIRKEKPRVVAPIKKPTLPSNSSVFSDLVGGLRNLGYKKWDAESRAKTVLEKYPSYSVEKLLLEAIR